MSLSPYHYVKLVSLILTSALGQAQLGCYEGSLRFRYSFIDCGSDLNLCVPLKDDIRLVQYAFWIMKSIFSKIKMFSYRKKRLV